MPEVSVVVEEAKDSTVPIVSAVSIVSAAGFGDVKGCPTRDAAGCWSVV